MVSEEKGSPNYVLKFDTACLTEVGSNLLYFIQVLAVAILFTMILSFNWPSGEMRFETRCLLCFLILIVTAVCFPRKKEYIRIPAELRFYDDHLVIYFLENDGSEEYNRINYKDVVFCTVYDDADTVEFYGSGESTSYSKDKDKYHSHKFGSIKFDTRYAKDISFCDEIANHSQIPVELARKNRGYV